MNARMHALSERLDTPLLVTNLTNVFYLTGFDSSNAALLVEPGGEATLYTDFRYIESAQEVPGVEVQLAKRGLMQDIGELLKGKVQFEADVLPYRGVGAPSVRRREAGPDARPRRRGPRGEGRRGGGEDQPLGEDRRPRPRGADRRDVDRPLGARARLAAPRAAACARRRRAVVRLDRRVGRERRQAARPSDRQDRRPRHARHRRLGRSGRRLLQRLHAHVLDRPAARSPA